MKKLMIQLMKKVMKTIKINNYYNIFINLKKFDI